MIYISALGQFDNIGDTILRRAYLDTLRLHDELCIYIGDRSDGYVSGLGLGASDRVIVRKADWKRELLGATSAGGAKLAFNTGELANRDHDSLASLRAISQVKLNRLRGGRALHLGFGLRKPDAVTSLSRRYFGGFDLVSWRDDASAVGAGFGSVHPDWAFKLGSFGTNSIHSSTGKAFCAVSLRYNSPPPDAQWISTVRKFASVNELEVVAVPQVARDLGRAIEVSRQLGGSVVDWKGDDHSAHEAKVRSVYSKSSVVVSDRLHALIVGATEGAYPLALVTSPATQFKIKRTLATAGTLDSGVFCIRGDSSAPTINELSDLANNKEELLRSVISARTSLSVLSLKISAALSVDQEGDSGVR